MAYLPTSLVILDDFECEFVINKNRDEFAFQIAKPDAVYSMRVDILLILEYSTDHHRVRSQHQINHVD